MATTTKRHTIELPEGAPPHAEPIEPGRRFKDGEVVLKRGTENDLIEMAKALYTEFPEDWWDKREPPETRPDPETRIRRCAERLKVLITIPGAETIIARDAHTGAFLGYGTWFVPGVGICLPFRTDTADFFNIRESLGWSKDYEEKLWSSINMDIWDPRWHMFDNDRKRIMGDEPHWYLAPLMTLKAHRGRGVAGLIMKYAIEKADNSTPPRPLYLEASTTGKPMYMHYGFVWDQSTETAMVRYPKGDPRHVVDHE